MIQHRTVCGERVRLIALPRPNRAAVRAWEAFTRSDSVFGLDVEATAWEELGTYDPAIKMRLIQFGTATEGWALDPTDSFWRPRIMAFLSDVTKRFVSHNAAYDTVRVEFEFGIVLGDRSIDTLVMAALRHPGRTLPKDLKSLSSFYIDDQLHEAEVALHARFMDQFTAQKPRKARLLPLSFVPGESLCRRPKGAVSGKCENVSDPTSLCGYCTEHYLARTCTAEAQTWGWANIALDDPIFLTYAGLDAVYCRRLLDLLAAEIKRYRMSRLSRQEQAVKRLMTDVSKCGHRVDVEWTTDVKDEIEQEFNAAENRIEIATGLKARSPNMREWLEDHGTERIMSLDRAHLTELAPVYADDELLGPIFADLLKVSEHSNLLTNLRTILLHATEGDGFTHANINTQQAHTGRMSITGPAMQTFAKKGLKGERLRGCYIAREGHVLVGADYDQQEGRIGAALSQDPALLRIIREGLNQHVLTAEQVFAKTWVDKEHSPAEYGYAKILDYGQQYGLGPKKLSRSLGVSRQEALEMWLGWRETYAGYVRWSEAQGRKAHVVNPFGRVIPKDKFREYANGNYVIQSTGRDLLGTAICNIGERGFGHWLWLPIHDELVLEVPEEEAEFACGLLTDTMTMHVPGTDMIVPAEGEVVGTRWRGLS